MAGRIQRLLHPADHQPDNAQLVALIELVLDDRALAFEVSFVDPRERPRQPIPGEREQRRQRARRQDLEVAGRVQAGVGVVPGAEALQAIAERRLAVCVRVKHEVLDQVRETFAFRRIVGCTGADRQHHGDLAARRRRFDPDLEAAVELPVPHLEARDVQSELRLGNQARGEIGDLGARFDRRPSH